MGWQWHQLDHMQIISTSLQTDNHASASSLNVLQAGCSSWCPANSVEVLTAISKKVLIKQKGKIYILCELFDTW